MKKMVTAPMPTQLSDYERGKADAFEEVYSSRAPADPGFPVTVVSVPGSAWDVLAKDRDEWKAKAVKAENLAANWQKRNDELVAREHDARLLVAHLRWLFGCKETELEEYGDIISDLECLRQLVRPVPNESDGEP